MEPAVRDYLMIGLRMGRLVDGYVDCWFGDPALARAVADEPTPVAAELARAASLARTRLPDSGIEANRQRYLGAQLRAVECAARRLAGEQMSFSAEVAAYFEVDITPTDPDHFAAVHTEIADLLPGAGDLSARLLAWREREYTPYALLGTAAAAVSDGIRRLAHDHFDVPAGEKVTYEVVTNQPWNAFNTYHGAYRSTVRLNADTRHQRSALPLLVTHESYPGHHVDHCVKERLLVRAGGQAEHTLALVNTPQCLVSEGAAEVAMTAVLPDGWGRWTERVLAGVGLAMDGELAERLLPLTTRLLAARLDAAIMLHDRGVDGDEVVAYLRRWMLVSEERARHMVRFLTNPLWRAYTVTYIEGARLVRRWLAARPPAQTVADRYRRLLVEPLLPATLREEIEAEPTRPGAGAQGPPGGGAGAAAPTRQGGHL